MENCYIKNAIRLYQTRGDEIAFQSVFKHCLPIFDRWRRRIQSKVRIDTQSLLSEFQYVIFRTIMQFDCSKKSVDFMGYFNLAAKRCANLIIKKSIKQQNNVSVNIDFIDKKSTNHIAKVDILDTIQAILSKKERMLVIYRLSGYKSGQIRHNLGLSDFGYRSMLSNIQSKIQKEYRLSGVNERN